MRCRIGSLQRTVCLFFFYGGVVGCSNVPPQDARRRQRRAKQPILAQDDLCEMGFHGSVILDDMLWTHGGYIVIVNENGNDTMAIPNRYLRSVDLLQSHDLGNLYDPAIRYYKDPEFVPAVSAQTLWGSRDRLYEIGGYHTIEGRDWDSNIKPPNGSQMSVYEIKTREWHIEPILDSEGEEYDRVEHPFAVTVRGQPGDTGYYLGGLPAREIGDYERDAEDVARFSMFDFESEKWTETPRHPGSRRGIPWVSRNYGKFLHLPFGENGLLAALGGFEGTKADKPKSGAVDLTRIDIFDLNAANSTSPGTWRIQYALSGNEKAPNEVPTDLINFCAVSVMAADNSSAQIFVYGGSMPNNNKPPEYQLGELWVLSIPSFQWFKLQDDNDQPVSLTNPGPKEGMTCDRWGKYMFMVGGRRLGDMQNYDPKDCGITGNYVLDLSSAKWLEEWDVGKAKGHYTIPDAVVKVIGGTPIGGSTKLPADNFTDPEMRQYFSAAVSTQKSPTDPSAERSSLEDDQSSSLSPGGIAGIVIGILAAVAIVAGLVYRKHRLNKRHQDHVQILPEERKKDGDHGAGIIPMYTESPGIPEVVRAPGWNPAAREMGSGKPPTPPSVHELQGISRSELA